MDGADGASARGRGSARNPRPGPARPPRAGRRAPRAAARARPPRRAQVTLAPDVLAAGRPVVARGPFGRRAAFRPVSFDRHEPVADVAHGADQGLVLGAELGPEPPDVHVDGAGAAEVVVAPDL